MKIVDRYMEPISDADYGCLLNTDESEEKHVIIM